MSTSRGSREAHVPTRRASVRRCAAAGSASLLMSLGLVVVITPTSSAADVFTDVAAGDAHSCAIRNGDVWCWGSNDAGQLGNPAVADVAASPVEVVGLPLPAEHIAAGGDHTCAVLEDTQVYCWGAN